MVTTRGKNATTDANPSVTKFTKEQNDFKMKQYEQYATKEPLDQYQLNLYIRSSPQEADSSNSNHWLHQQHKRW